MTAFPFAKDCLGESFPFVKDFCFANSAFPFAKELLGFALALDLPSGKACDLAFAIAKKANPFNKEFQTALLTRKKNTMSRNEKLHIQQVFCENKLGIQVVQV